MGDIVYCSACNVAMTSYHPQCLDEVVKTNKDDVKELLKQLNDLRRENAAYREKLLAGKVGRDIERHEDSAKEKILTEKKKSYKDLVELEEAKINNKKTELEELKKQRDEMIAVKGEGPKGDMLKSQSKKVDEIGLIKSRLRVLNLIKTTYFISGRDCEVKCLLKSSINEENSTDKIGVYFKIQHVSHMIAQCYLLDLPKEYNICDKSVDNVKANLYFLCDYFGFKKEVDDIVTVNKLLLERIKCERDRLEPSKRDTK